NRRAPLRRVDRTVRVHDGGAEPLEDSAQRNEDAAGPLDRAPAELERPSVDGDRHLLRDRRRGEVREGKGDNQRSSDQTRRRGEHGDPPILIKGGCVWPGASPPCASATDANGNPFKRETSRRPQTNRGSPALLIAIGGSCVSFLLQIESRCIRSRGRRGCGRMFRKPLRVAGRRLPNAECLACRSRRRANYSPGKPTADRDAIGMVAYRRFRSGAKRLELEQLLPLRS